MKWHQKALVRIFSSNILTFLFLLIALGLLALLVVIDKFGEFNINAYLCLFPIVITQALVMAWVMRSIFKFCTKNIDIN